MVYQPKEIPEDINVTPVHPLVNFANLLLTVVVVSGLAYLGLGAIANQLVTRISPAMEIKIGKKLLPPVNETVRSSNAKKRQYLEQLLASLKTPAMDREIPLTIQIHKSKIANAAIFPGGHILVTTALLEEAESENELAFVLAHELGHHVARDPLKGLGRSLVFLTVATALGMGTGNADIVNFTGSLTTLHYSRQQETAADLYALESIIDLYGHGAASLDFFKRVQTRDKRNELSVYLSTHPLTEERIDYLRQVATKKNWQMRGEVTDLPYLFDN